ncbi:unnamed protein product, partial [Diabrotica balteata]
MRVCLGAMRSTPIQPLYVEAAELPFENRRNFLSEKSLLKILLTNSQLFSSVRQLNEADLTNKYLEKKPSPLLCMALQNNPIFLKKLHMVDRSLDYFSLFHRTEVPTYSKKTIMSSNLLISLLQGYSNIHGRIKNNRRDWMRILFTCYKR